MPRSLSGDVDLEYARRYAQELEAKKAKRTARVIRSLVRQVEQLQKFHGVA